MPNYQLKILYRDNKGNLVTDWFPKKFLCLISSASSLIREELPLAADKDMSQVVPQKEL